MIYEYVNPYHYWNFHPKTESYFGDIKETGKLRLFKSRRIKKPYRSKFFMVS